MNTRCRLLVPILGLLALPLIAGSAVRKGAETEGAKPKTVTTRVQQLVATTGRLKPAPTTTALQSPQSGELIKWQVVASGGGASSSTNYKLSMTVGQTAVGGGSATNYKVNQGFWQNFSSGICCIGKRGNVNMAGIIDLVDLSSLVSYLTGGAFVPPCTDAANVNGLGIVDLVDLSSLVSYLTGGAFVLIDCP